MFFKRKTINPDFQERASSSPQDQDGIDSGKSSHYLNEEEQQQHIMQSNDPNSSEGESIVERKRRVASERDKAVDEAKKQIEQELETKHYYHQRLLETLDLGLLSSLDKDKGELTGR